MAVSKTSANSGFSLTGNARALAERAPQDTAASRAEPPAPAPVPAQPAREIDAKPVSIRFWHDQADLLFELRYRSRNAWTMNDLVRRAVDEYILNHANELMASPEECRAIEAASTCKS